MSGTDSAIADGHTDGSIMYTNKFFLDSRTHARRWCNHITMPALALHIFAEKRSANRNDELPIGMGIGLALSRHPAVSLPNPFTCWF